VSASISNRTVFSWSFFISSVVIGFLLWLIYIKDTPGQSSTATVVLPTINALLNGLSACFLTAGYIAIKRRRVKVHKSFMVAALVSSALFLISYVIYHNAHGDTAFQGAGFIRIIYFFILISHILLTTVALPIILVTFFFALTNKFDAHRKIARITLPAWLYVSVTGVLIFFLLKLFS
jgi:putative membrane protein